MALNLTVCQVHTNRCLINDKKYFTTINFLLTGLSDGHLSKTDTYNRTVLQSDIPAILQFVLCKKPLFKADSSLKQTVDTFQRLTDNLKYFRVNTTANTQLNNRIVMSHPFDF